MIVLFCYTEIQNDPSYSIKVCKDNTGIRGLLVYIV